MMIKNRFSLFVTTFLIIGFFFLALPEKGYSGIRPLGCCEDIADNCIGCGSLECAIQFSECEGIPVSGGFSPGEACFDNDKCSTPKEGDFGCCVISAGSCNENQEFEDCDGVGIAWFFDANCSEVPECAPIVTDVPTLNEWGLIAMVGILGIVGFMVMRRRKVTA